MAQKPRVLIVSFGIHGMVNPSLRLAERLVAAGADVTFSTTVSSHRAVVQPRVAGGDVTFAPFSDGHDAGFDFMSGGDVSRYDSEIRTRGSGAVAELITEAKLAGKPFSCVVYTPVVTWAADVADELEVPAVLLWVQAATVFSIIHAYFDGHERLIGDYFAGKDYDRVLTEFESLGLPFDLAVRDLPDFMDLSSSQAHYSKYFREDFSRFVKSADADQHDQHKGVFVRKVLVNTFDSLEPEALRCMESRGARLIGIGPLAEDPPRARSTWDRANEWLRDKEKGSVVYVSFGSLSTLAEKQTDEVARALLEFGRPFVWVVRGEMPRHRRWSDEVAGLGVIVPWCDQVAVLESGAIGCFVTHCGWNSTLESLSAGVPMVGFPQRIDQLTNAKLAQDYWKVSVRVRADEHSGVADGDEIKRCLESVFRNEFFSRNAEKWKGLAREALLEDGSSPANLEKFLNQLT